MQALAPGQATALSCTSVAPVGTAAVWIAHELPFQRSISPRHCPAELR
jgi:hypothetical protein